jgi:hypothetical protein
MLSGVACLILGGGLLLAPVVLLVVAFMRGCARGGGQARG